MKRFSIGLMTLLVIPHGTWCQPTEDVTPRAIIHYAESLAVRHEFKAAAEEYIRMLTYFPSLSAKPELFRAAFQMAVASEDYPYAMAFVQNTLSFNDSPELSCLVRYYRGQLLYRMKQYDTALDALRLPQECVVAHQAEFAFSRSLVYLRKREWAHAEEELKLADDYPIVENDRAGVAAAIAQGRAEAFRNPGTAAVWSAVVPGSGYAYSKQPKSAFAAFVTTGLLAWGAVSAFDKRETGVGVLFGLIGTGWYFGGVYGSARAAEKYNNYRADQIIGPLEKF